MTRRILHAVAALAVFVIASLVWTQPAQAAPGGLCSSEEWRHPASFVDCARRTGAAAGQKAGCVTAPTPGTPTEGMAGWFTARPDSSLRDGVAGQYSQYGVGGYGLDTYDIGCLAALKQPQLSMENWIASGEFQGAASIMAAANGLRERAYNPGSMWGWSDSFLQSTTSTTFKYIFTPIGAMTIAVIGLGLIWQARSGNMSKTMQITAWALFVMVAVTGVAKYPVGAAHTADAAVTKGLSGIHSVLGPGPKDIPAAQCVLGGDACIDHRSVATRSSDVVVDAVLYRSWLTAVLGSADTDTAKKYGPALYDATSMTWGEAARVQNNATLRVQLLEQKAQTFNTIAAQIQVEDPVAYEHLRGIHAGNRVGYGLVAIVSSALFAAFDVTASVVILFGFLIFRVAIIFLPLLGTFGMAMPAAGPVRRVFHMTVSAAANILVFGAGTGIYLTAVDWIFRSPLPGFAQTLAVAATGVLFFVLLRPARHLFHTATGRARDKPTLTSRMFSGGKEIYDNKSGGTEAAPADAGPGAPTRPETASPRPRSTARVVTTAVAPSVADAAGHPAVSAVLGAVSSSGSGGQRPEGGGSKGSKVKAAVGLIATVAATAAGGPPAGAAASAATSAATSRPSPRPRAETRS